MNRRFVSVYLPHLNGDIEKLKALCLWCKRYTPLTALDEPSGLILDTTGCDHLFGGERTMLELMLTDLRRLKLEVRVALGPTPGSARAFALYKSNVIVAQCDLPYALYPLPLESLGFDSAIVGSLHQLGITHVRELLRLPRVQLFKRFGQSILTRLDEVLGDRADPKTALPETQRFVIERFLSDTVRDHAYLCQVIECLLVELCAKLETMALGLTHLKLTLTHLDRRQNIIEIGSSQATHQSNPLMRLLTLKLESTHAGLGIEKVRLEASKTQGIEHHQIHIDHRLENNERDLAFLFDTLKTRLGNEPLFGLLPNESHLPERSVLKTALGLSSLSRISAEPKSRSKRPVRLLAQPDPIEAIAMLPDAPPRRLTWRQRHIFDVIKADGPERIEGEWWKDNELTRDYYVVENQEGTRLWVFKQSTPPQWFLHGFFA